MNEDCQNNNDVLTEDMVRRVFELGDGIPEKYYYPINQHMWEDLLKLGWTEKQLTNYGFIKTDYIEEGE